MAHEPISSSSSSSGSGSGSGRGSGSEKKRIEDKYYKKAEGKKG